MEYWNVYLFCNKKGEWEKLREVTLGTIYFIIKNIMTTH